jgi:hypothetical protein
VDSPLVLEPFVDMSFKAHLDQFRADGEQPRDDGCGGEHFDMAIRRSAMRVRQKRID